MDVVIPIQTISFYNVQQTSVEGTRRSCHTYPNDKLLQLEKLQGETVLESCHTYPNDKLLQRFVDPVFTLAGGLSYLSKR